MPSFSRHTPRGGPIRATRWLRDRNERTHWLIVIGLAAIALAVTIGADARADAAADRWGDRVSALQASADLPPGVVVEADHVRIVEVPRHLLPSDALPPDGELGSPSRNVPVGTLLSSSHFGDFIGVGSDQRAVPVPAPVGVVAPPVGEPLELVITPVIDPYSPGGAAPIVVPARLLAATENSWLIEVAVDDAVLLATAATSGTVVPLLLPG